MATIDLSGAGSGLTNLNSTVTASSLTPKAQYDAWVTAVGASTTGTMFSLAGDNSIQTISLSTPIWGNQVAPSYYISTEGGLLFYKTALAAGASAAFMSVPNVNQMIGWSDQPDVIFTFHPVGKDAATAASSQIRTAGGETIILFILEDSLTPGTTIAEVAVRFTSNLIEFVGKTITGSTDFYVTAYSATDTLSNQTLLLSQAAGGQDLMSLAVQTQAGVPYTGTALHKALTLTGNLASSTIGNSQTALVGTGSLVFNTPIFGPIIQVNSGFSLHGTGNTPTIIQGVNTSVPLLNNAILHGRVPNNIIIDLTGESDSFVGGLPSFGIIINSSPDSIGLRYSAILTGTQDGLADVILPLHTLTLRIAKGNKNTASISIPNGGNFLSSISARPNGLVTIHEVTIYSDGTTKEVISEPFNVKNFSSSQGAKHFSITMALSGIIPVNNSPTQYKLSGISFVNTDASGSLRVRATPIAGLNVGDSVEISPTLIVSVTKVVKNFSKRLVTMEVSDG